jgi:hypothetical protein
MSTKLSSLLTAAALWSLAGSAMARDHAYEWRTRADKPDQIYLFDHGEQVGGWDYARGYWRDFDAKAGAWSETVAHEVPTKLPSKAGMDALAEVNALRAQSGLPPYIYDDGLTKAAEACATYRANYLIEGHTSNDFAFVPAGSYAASAGCAAWAPSMGWGSCCCYDHYTFAGAGWAMGRDGRRYMHLYVR